MELTYEARVRVEGEEKCRYFLAKLNAEDVARDIRAGGRTAVVEPGPFTQTDKKSE